MRIGLILMVVCTGCATTIRTPQEVASRCKTSRDDYKKIIELDSGRYDVPGQTFSTYELSAVRHFDSKEVLYGMHVSAFSHYWVFFENATDSDGKRLACEVTDRRVDSPQAFFESIIFVFNRDYLNQHAGKGLNFRIDGQRGSMIVVVPSYVLDGFLSSVDSQL